jgi:DNA helicase-2/ATP-dependent DNA helicase PcrA
MMTVHSAKGWSSTSSSPAWKRACSRTRSSSREHGVEEERRLMYVAITRARQRLYLSFAQTRMLHGQTRYNMKSRFFDELPEDALKWLTPKVQPSWFGGKKSAWDEVPMVGSDKALAQKIASKAQARLGLAHGQSVAHAKFGEGVIVNIEGSGNNARAQINLALPA